MPRGVLVMDLVYGFRGRARDGLDREKRRGNKRGGKGEKGRQMELVE